MGKQRFHGRHVFHNPVLPSDDFAIFGLDADRLGKTCLTASYPIMTPPFNQIEEGLTALEAPGHRLFGNNSLFVVGASFSSTESSAQQPACY